jgi:hypothetical protein
MVRLQRSITRTPRARALATTRERKVRIEFRRAAGQVETAHGWAGGNEIEHCGDGLRAHFLGALGAGVDVAVQAALVAAVAKVELQGLDAAPAQGGKVGLGQQGQGGVHGFLRGYSGLVARRDASLHSVAKILPDGLR